MLHKKVGISSDFCSPAEVVRMRFASEAVCVYMYAHSAPGLLCVWVRARLHMRVFIAPLV